VLFLVWLSAMVALANALVAVIVRNATLTTTITSGGVVPSPSGGALPAGFVLSMPADTPLTLDVPHLPTGLQLLMALPRVLTLFFLGFGLLVLRRLLATIFAGKPFDPANPDWLALLAVSVLAGGSAHTWLQGWANHRVLDHLASTGHRLPLSVGSLPFTPYLVATGALLVLTWAFRRGLQVSRDIEGLV
jgi:hypothetical protein